MAESNLLSTLAQSIDANTLAQLGQVIGADKGQTNAAVSAALPVLVAALAKNASTPKGAESLAGALDRDHDGSLLANLGGMLGQMGGQSATAAGGGGPGALLGVAASMLTSAPGPSSAKTVDGAGILGHLLGAKEPAVKSGVSKSSGLSGEQSGQLLAMLAPLVMGAIGKEKQAKGLGAKDLSPMLKQESAKLGGGGGVLEALLDKNDDGNIADDVAKVGLELAGKKLMESFFK